MVAPAASYARMLTLVRGSVAMVREQDVSRLGLKAEKHGGLGTGTWAWITRLSSTELWARRDAETRVERRRSAAAATRRKKELPSRAMVTCDRRAAKISKIEGRDRRVKICCR